MSAAHAARTRIKICGLTREQDVDAAVDAGADAVGFVLYPASPRCVTRRTRGAELARAPAALRDAGAAVRQRSRPHSRGGLRTRARLRRPVPRRRDARSSAWRPAAGGRRPFLRAARIPLGEAGPFDLLKFASDYASAQAILLDAHVEGYGGGGKAFDWSLLPPSVDRSPRFVWWVARLQT